jgi:hypothetical protein
MSANLPFAGFATPEEPVRCDWGKHWIDHGAFAENADGGAICHCCLADTLTAIDELYRLSHPVTYPQAEEARDV